MSSVGPTRTSRAANTAWSGSSPPPSPSPSKARGGTSPTRSVSPDSTCPICLGELSDRAFTDACSHTFCFECIKEWSSIKPQCPLCKKFFTEIRHNAKATERSGSAAPSRKGKGHQGSKPQYDTYRLPAAAAAAGAPPGSFPHFRYSMESLGVLSHPLYIGLPFAGHGLADGSSPHNDIINWTNLRTSQRIRSMFQERSQARRLRSGQIRSLPPRHTRQFRQAVYAARARCSTRSRTADFTTAHFFRNNNEALRRMHTFVQRECQALFPQDTFASCGLVSRVMDLLTEEDLMSAEFEAAVARIVRSRAAHFIHELVEFARAYPMLRADYDANATYPSLPQPRHSAAPSPFFSSDIGQPRHGSTSRLPPQNVFGDAHFVQVMPLSGPAPLPPSLAPPPPGGAEPFAFRAPLSSPLQRPSRGFSDEVVVVSSSSSSDWSSDSDSESQRPRGGDTDVEIISVVSGSRRAARPSRPSARPSRTSARPSRPSPVGNAQDLPTDGSDSDVILVSEDRPYADRSPIVLSSDDDTVAGPSSVDRRRLIPKCERDAGDISTPHERAGRSRRYVRKNSDSPGEPNSFSREQSRRVSRILQDRVRTFLNSVEDTREAAHQHRSSRRHEAVREDRRSPVTSRRSTATEIGRDGERGESSRLGCDRSSESRWRSTSRGNYRGPERCPESRGPEPSESMRVTASITTYGRDGAATTADVGDDWFWGSLATRRRVHGNTDNNSLHRSRVNTHLGEAAESQGSSHRRGKKRKRDSECTEGKCTRHRSCRTGTELSVETTRHRAETTKEPKQKHKETLEQHGEHPEHHGANPEQPLHEDISNELPWVSRLFLSPLRDDTSNDPLLQSATEFPMEPPLVPLPECPRSPPTAGALALDSYHGSPSASDGMEYNSESTGIHGHTEELLYDFVDSTAHPDTEDPIVISDESSQFCGEEEVHAEEPHPNIDDTHPNVDDPHAHIENPDPLVDEPEPSPVPSMSELHPGCEEAEEEAGPRPGPSGLARPMDSFVNLAALDSTDTDDDDILTNRPIVIVNRQRRRLEGSPPEGIKKHRHGHKTSST